MEHDACGVGLIASTNGKKSRKIIDYGIQALKSIWHRGAVDADGKSGDGAGIQLSIPKKFFKEQIERTGHKTNSLPFAIGMVFLPRTNFDAQEKSRIIIESEIFLFALFLLLKQLGQLFPNHLKHYFHFQ